MEYVISHSREIVTESQSGRALIFAASDLLLLLSFWFHLFVDFMFEKEKKLREIEMFAVLHSKQINVMSKYE